MSGQSEDVIVRLRPASNGMRCGPAPAFDDEGSSASEGCSSVRVVTADRTSRDLTFLWNQGGGNFLRKTWQGAVMAPSALLATDLAGDGETDLVVGLARERRAEDTADADRAGDTEYADGAGPRPHDRARASQRPGARPGPHGPDRAAGFAADRVTSVEGRSLRRP